MAKQMEIHSNHNDVINAAESNPAVMHGKTFTWMLIQVHITCRKKNTLAGSSLFKKLNHTGAVWIITKKTNLKIKNWRFVA